MFESYATPARSYAPGIGEAVANRTVNRKVERLFDYIMLEPFEVPRRDDISLDHEIEEYCKSKGLLITGYDVTYEVNGEQKVVRMEDRPTVDRFRIVDGQVITKG